MSDVSTFFELLSAEPRRQILVTLCDVESVQVPDGLFTRSAARSAPAAAPSGPADAAADRRTRDIQLHHTHLPKLEAEGLVEWDRETGTASRGPAFAEFEPAVRLLATNPQALPGSFF